MSYLTDIDINKRLHEHLLHYINTYLWNKKSKNKWKNRIEKRNKINPRERNKKNSRKK